jgi:6-pyruvoyl-tetrahydropterin synthase
MATCRLGKSGFRFNALHSFPDDAGYDRFAHGHDYELTVMVEGERAAGQMLLDMRHLRAIVEKSVIAKLDHQNLDQVLGDGSLEALAEWIWRELREALPRRLRIGVVLWETRTIFAEYWGETTAPET